MYDALPVRRVERLADLNAIAHDLVRRERSLCQAIGKRFAFEELHHEVIRPAILPYVVQSTDVRMAEGGDGARFACEALLKFRLRAQRFRQHFYCDVSSQSGI